MKLFEITGIQRGCVSDGSGIRTVIFFRGCPFSCPWCCNPETQWSSPKYYVDENKCLQAQNVKSLLCNKCERKGYCVSILNCPWKVALPTFKTINEEELLYEVLKDKSIYITSGGGITLSGGEPLLHVNKLYSFLGTLQKLDITCAIETTLYCDNEEYIINTLPYINEWIIDLKIQPEVYKEDYLDIITRNLSILRHKEKRLTFRLVYVSSLNAEKTYSILSQLDISKIELLKCHSLAEVKYKKLGLVFENYEPSLFDLQSFSKQLTAFGVTIEQKFA